MKVVLISDNGSYHKKLTVKLWRQLILPLILLSFLIVGVIGISKGANSFSVSKLLASKDDKEAYKNFDSVLYKLSGLDAEVQRLNALSTYIAQKNKVNINEYDLSHAPARGGSSKNSYFGSIIVRHKDVKTSIATIENDLEKQKIKLRNLVTSLEIKEAENYLSQLSRSLGKTSIRHPDKHTSTKVSRNSALAYDFSTPLENGYISSPYGSRRDPINGSMRHHNGLDIAAKTGSSVYAIANGFVTYRGKKGAYGNLLEVNHSETLKSRYAHLSTFLVKQGDMVKKGDVIGKVGATGRVTGPHLHLEIKENNKIVDPKLYLNDALKSL